MYVMYKCSNDFEIFDNKIRMMQIMLQDFE